MNVPDTSWSSSPEKILEALESAQEGLSTGEVQRRLQTFGKNQLRKIETRSLWSILLDQVKSLVVILLIAAAVVSFLFGETIEAIAIGIVIVVNTAIGFFTELRAVRSMEALRTLGGIEATVRRDGEIQRIDAEDLVPGDIVLLDSGDAIPADLRLLSASKLQVDESPLTGESTPVDKSEEAVGEETILADRSSMAYKGTTVTRGTAEGVVVGTGMETELGEISALVESAEDADTPLEEKLDVLGRKLVYVTLGIAGLVTAIGIASGRDLLLMIETGIALAVAAVPEGLPIVATIALARGMWRMVQRNALVRKLASVETLGATSVIFTDKTGTITENQMTVTTLELPSGTIEVSTDENGQQSFRRNGDTVSPDSAPWLRSALEAAVLCNNATLEHARNGAIDGIGDPMELALMALGDRAGLSRSTLIEDMPEVREESFERETTMMATFHQTGEQYPVMVKGAPEAVLDASTTMVTEEGPVPLDESQRKQWLQKNQEMAATGLRILALARKEVDNPEAAPYEDLQFLGLVGLLDPPRNDVRDAIERCESAGVKVVMVTGDHPETAATIAQEVGLMPDDGRRESITGHTFIPIDELSPEERQEYLQAPLFARVNPRQKLMLIDLHQDNGAIVAMTGDGVNDAPALKSADIGIAMGKRGTEVAREAADIILLDDAFSTIVTAVEQGRVIFDNIRTFVRYLLSCNVGEIFTVGVAAAINAPLPILPLQILFLNLVTDVFPALALGVGEGDEHVMDRPPRPSDEAILQQGHWMGIGLYGLFIAASVLTAFEISRQWLGLSTPEAVTISFMSLALGQLWHVFNMRKPESSVVSNEITRNGYVWGAIVLCLGLLAGALYIPAVADVLQLQPPTARGWLLIAGGSFLPLLAGQTYLSLRGRLI